ncbi:3-oxoacyl-ACP synthase [Helicobacter sp. 16-1353]|uniref:beta-ketoacyl-ACP synthase III n=1 Tax=Helicobacter sp. 16-1353 TaxID=2004996 RepID=UPI000DCB3AE1|nr:beta-ketoacyl-ACP synthase III [Helicobacter sp. 16-1353]RAX54767.1 3-oxoacyl-ACP synthase [Helicobacter sp. 16-1353]
MVSIASYIPKNCINNKDFEKFIDTSDEWITKRTGIKTRYFADSEETSSDIGVKAAKVAIQRAGISIDDIDIVICATLSPDYLGMPSNACLISYRLGIENKPAFDIISACSGFIYLLSLAKSFIESNMYKNVLIVGAEKISSILDFNDRGTCVLFGDGAGAAVISATNDKSKRIIDVNISANGKYNDFLMTPICSNGGLDSVKNIKNTTGKPLLLKMKGNETFKLAVKTLANDVKEILLKNNIKSEDISYFIPHQANLRIINAVGDIINIDSNKIVLTIQKYGNTSAASIPMAIDDIYSSGKLKNGDLLLLDAFGGGLTWGSSLLYFNG